VELPHRLYGGIAQDLLLATAVRQIPLVLHLRRFSTESVKPGYPASVPWLSAKGLEADEPRIGL